MFARRLARVAAAAASAAVVGFGVPVAAEAAKVDAVDAVADSGLFVVRQAVHPDKFRAFRVQNVKTLADGTRIVRLGMRSKYGELGAAPVSHLVAEAGSDGARVTGAVTPISAVEAKGFVELAVSPTDEDPIAQAILGTPVGNEIKLKGPFKGFQISRNQFKSLGIVARGSAVTAALQVITALLSDPRDDTEIRLFYSAESPSHVMLRNHLDALALIHPRFKLTIIVDEADASWGGLSGPVTKAELAYILPAPTEGDDTAILVAGDGQFKSSIKGDDDYLLGGMLKDMMYLRTQVHSI